MIGRAIIFIFGLPSLIAAFIYGKVAYDGDCLEHLVGVIHCGPSIYIYSVIFIVIFLLTLFLAHLWRD